VLHCGAQRFESPLLHQVVRANRRDYLVGRIARHFRGLRRQWPVCHVNHPVRLMERREEGLTRGHIPARGLILVAAADVQMNGIWVEVIAIAQNRESWVVEALWLGGETDSPDGESFVQLKERILDHSWPDAFGGTRKIDALGVDSGYRSHVVYAWTRTSQRIRSWGSEAVVPLKGADGFGRPAIGLPTKVDIDFAGRRVRRGASVRLVGTWSLKGVFYSDLRKDGVRAGAEVDPPGYCHFPSWLDDSYFRQITSEYLAEEIFKGKPRKFWKLRGGQRDNHFLDCRAYNLALLEYLGFSKLTSEDWSELARERGAPAGEAVWPTVGVDQDGDDEAAAVVAEVAAIAPEGRRLTWGEAVNKLRGESHV
jgi:phage terminase large subunit GpA-like protein